MGPLSFLSLADSPKRKEREALGVTTAALSVSVTKGSYHPTWVRYLDVRVVCLICHVHTGVSSS
jgi:hypothetical protein